MKTKIASIKRIRSSAAVSGVKCPYCSHYTLWRDMFNNQVRCSRCGENFSRIVVEPDGRTIYEQLDGTKIEF